VDGYSEILQIILDTSTPEEVLTSVLEKCINILGADAATIVIWDSGLGFFNNTMNIPDDIPLKGMILQPDQGGLDGRVHREQESKEFIELTNYSKNMDANPKLKPAGFSHAIGFSSNIQNDFILITVCFYYLTRKERFSEKEKETLRIIRTHIGLAMLSAQLHQNLDEISKSNQETKNFLELLMNSSPDIIINTDLTGKIQSWNSAAETSFGYSMKEIINKKLPLTKGENEEKFYIQLKEARNGKPVYNIDFQFESNQKIDKKLGKNEENHELLVNLSLIPVFSKYEGIDSLLITGKDISWKNSLEKEVKQYHIDLNQKDIDLSKKEKLLNKTKNELSIAEKLATIGVISARLNHQINNPLMGLLSILSITLDEIKDLQGEGISETGEAEGKFPENLEKLIVPQLEDAIIHGKRIKYVLKELRYFSEVAKEIHFRKNTDLIEVVKQTLKDYKRKKTSRKIKFNYSKKSDKALIYGNFNQLKYVVKSILDNAYTAVELKPDKMNSDEIEILTQNLMLNKKKFVRLKIKDSGIGISKDQHKFLFEPFYTAWTLPTDDLEQETDLHVGLSLATTKIILQNHNASIKVLPQEESTTNKEDSQYLGTSIIIDFPIE